MHMKREFLKYMLPNVVESTTTKEEWCRQLELCLDIFGYMLENGKDIRGNELSEIHLKDSRIIYNRLEKQLDIVNEIELLEE